MPCFPINGQEKAQSSKGSIVPGQPNRPAIARLENAPFSAGDCFTPSNRSGASVPPVGRQNTPNIWRVPRGLLARYFPGATHLMDQPRDMPHLASLAHLLAVEGRGRARRGEGRG